MAGRYNPKKLIVEGDQDKRVIPELMEANGIAWGNTRETAVVDIEAYGSDRFIDEIFISTELKASGRTSLGLIVDADNDLNVRWQSVRNACLASIPDIPQKLPATGLIHPTDSGIKFGVWIMPDNQTQGMLETFLTYLIPNTKEYLWQYARDVTQEASNKGASFIENHFEKACIYTWLAWQNPPGRQLHNAVMEKILDPTHPRAQSFVNWFRTLYDL
ncbi:DUF3226 domain-containing protein [Geitlerinema sp. PCC 9228]|jgi:hypothetical protein|uniref:DUF3226 domain-containing protein n=1 Tax=Geitlerinema sp. PCC 9228 TaxID=111611 RepID=UPI0008F9DE73|nr:DUF3226 domain-containing protein [Geitlerinema sp. PCC 9228]